MCLIYHIKMQYIPINKEVSTNKIHIIVNKNNNQYIRFSCLQENCVINSVHAFIIKYGIWKTSDTIVLIEKDINFNTTDKYSDVSFILNFYQLAINGIHNIHNMHNPTIDLPLL